MKDMTFETLLAVFLEMMGDGFWLLAGASVVGLVAILTVMLRERRLVAARFVAAEVAGLAGGVFAIWLALTLTRSGIGDIGGPVDWLLMALLFGLGAVGGTIFAYVGLGLIAMARGRRA